jgi:glutathione S-transferase
MLTIHHIEGRRSERIAWLMEELGLPYKLEFKLGDVPGSLVALSSVHEMRMAPTVVDGELTLIESGAIIEYILYKYGNGRLAPPRSSPDYLRYLQFLHFAEGSAAPRILPHWIAKITGKELDSFTAGLGGFPRVMKYIEHELGERPYFAGDEFSAADIMMHFPLKLAKLLLKGLSEYPNADAYFRRITERPAFKAAMAATMPNGPPKM